MEPKAADRGLPTGTLTFMFTDIEGSTEHAHSLDAQVFSSVIGRHHEILRDVLEQHDGVEVATEGDAFFAVFEDPADAIEAAGAIQQALDSEKWPGGIDLKVRIGLHTGQAMLGGDNYVGVDVHRASRIAHVAHGGQVTMSSAVADVLPELESSYRARELGRFRLAGFTEAEPIYQLEIPGRKTEFPPPRGARPVSRLPEDPSPFVGRQDELARGMALLDQGRLTTLTGPGGSGKTRLAIELARHLEPSVPDGAFFISLADITDPDLIPMTTLESMGISFAAKGDAHSHLVNYLSDRELVLVLDNMEQLSDAGGEFVAGLLREANAIRIIATSRAPLRVAGERELPVPPLPIPEDGEIDLESASGFAGVRLFANRATAVRPDFKLTEDNVHTVLALTRRLDGLPLAIELAASKVSTFTPDLILQRLDNQMLSARAPDLPERQQTIIGAIGWSYDLLDEASRDVFERCSVFSGSFALSETERVCSAGDEQIDILGALVTLTENSLIQSLEDVGEPRYRMLVVIKEYAYAALSTRSEADLYEREHAHAYVDLAEQAAPEILTSKQRQWLDRLTSDHDNLRTAFDWAMRTKDASVALRLVASLWRFWQIRGHLSEARQKTEAALAMTGGTPRERGKALLALGGIKYWQGRWTDTLEPYTKAFEILKEHGDDEDIADAAYNLAFPLGHVGELERAESLLRESLEISERLGDRIGMSRAYWGLGDMAGYLQDWDRELKMMTRATELLEDQDAPFDRGWAHFMTAYGHHHGGENDEALSQLLAALDIFAGVSDLSAMTLIFEGLGLNALRSGEPIRAARLAGAAHRIRKETGVAIAEVEINQYPEVQSFLNEPDEVTKAAYQEGFEMTLDEVLAMARDSGGH